MSSAQYLSDVATRHAVFLQRYANGQSRDAISVLNRLKKTIKKRLELEPTNFQRNRLSKVLKDINGISKIGFKELKQQVLSSNNSLVISEAKYSKDLFTKAVNANFILPADAVLIANVKQSTMDVAINAGITINKALDQFGKNKSKQIARAISDGVTLGDTTQQIVSNINKSMDTLMRRQVTSLVSTMANHTSSVARESLYSENDDILDGYKWLSTLDSSTTIICGSRDGVFYKKGGDNPYPPAHFGCRSTTIPSIKPEYDIGSKLKGERPAIGADGVEQVSARKTYSGWLKSQPKDFVDEALGVERSKLFRSGKLKLDKFIDPTGKRYTLKQLESMNKISIKGAPSKSLSKNKRTLMLPSGRKAEFTVHKHGNTEILIQDNMSPEQQINASKMKKYINEVPKEYRGQLKEVRVMDEYFQEEGVINKNSVATFDIKSKHIEFYRNGRFDVEKLDKIMGDTVRHEVGHITESNMTKSFLNDWKIAAKADAGHITDYAKTDIYEDVAETIMNHWSPDRMERRTVEMFFPERFSVLKKYNITTGG